MLYIDKLVELLSPPVTLDTLHIKENLELVEKHYNIIYPDDYKSYIMRYGIGQINDFLTIYIPINKEEYYLEMMRNCNNYRDFKKMFPENYTFDIFPEKGGLLPLGITDGGSELWWKTSDKKENWTIVIYNENSWEYTEYNMQLCEFLYKYFTKEIDCAGFSESLRNGKIYFRSCEFDYKKYCEEIINR